jgi:hypothetical protein
MKFKDILYKITHWETWHYVVKYIPLTPVWIWYCIRSRNPWFFNSSNPTLSFGGFEGEGKKEMYEQLPPGTYPRTIYISPSLSFQELEDYLLEHQFVYPFIVKPDVGMMGFMVRKISNREQLKKYHDTLPVQYIVQTLVDYPIEVAIFYYRLPDQKRGTVSGMLKKEPAYVVGNGRNTLLELMEADRNIRFKLEDIKTRNQEQLNRILPEGERFNLSLASNRSQGGLVEGIDHEIDENLQRQLDNWSHYSGKFYYGRYDIKCATVESLKQGKDFYILEFNGAGAGIQHISANNYSLFTALSIILRHWKMMFRISRYNRRNGVKHWGAIEGGKFLNAARKNLLMLKKMDAEFPSF